MSALGRRSSTWICRLFASFVSAAALPGLRPVSIWATRPCAHALLLRPSTLSPSTLFAPNFDGALSPQKSPRFSCRKVIAASGLPAVLRLLH